MAIQLAARDRSETKKVLSSWLRDVFAGSLCGVLSIAFGLSYAVLIFSGPLTPWLTYGVAATFASTGIAALVVALRGSLPFAIAGPDSSTSAVTAVLAAALAERLVAEGAGNQLLMPTLIVMAIGSALTGFCCAGWGSRALAAPYASCLIRSLVDFSVRQAGWLSRVQCWSSPICNSAYIT